MVPSGGVGFVSAGARRPLGRAGERQAVVRREGMSKQPRRLRKKVHSLHKDEVLLAAISSPDMGSDLLALGVGQFVTVSPSNSAALRERARYLVNRWRLSFTLLRVAGDDGPGATDPFPVPGSWSFRLEAKEFPSVAVWAEELPEQIGRTG